MAQTNSNGHLLNLDSNSDLAIRQQTQAATSRDRVVLASIDYDPQSGAYYSRQISVDSLKQRPAGKSRHANNGNHLKTTNNQHLIPSSSIIEIARTTFGRQAEHFNEQNSLLKNGALVWDEKSNSLALDWPVHLRSDKFLSVGSIESYRDQPLFIAGDDDQAERAPINPDDELQPEQSPRGFGEILVSTQARPKSSSSSQTNANHILLPSSYNSLNARHSNIRRPVEMVASSLILNQFVEIERTPAQIEPVSSDDWRVFAQTKGRSQKMTNHFMHTQRPNRQAGGNQSKRQSTSNGAARAHVSKRLLELDGQRQSIVVPLLNRIDLFPSSAKTLFVRGEFRCLSTINGKLYENLDLQARWGNLSFESGRTLRIVSRSDKLDLAASRLVSLEAPTLRLSAPKTNKLLISDGIKFFKMDEYEERAESNEETIRHTLQSAPLEGFKLVLIDDILMASPD